MFLANPFAVVVAILIATELCKAGKGYSGRILLFNILTLIAMCVFVIEIPATSTLIVKLIAIGAALLFNIADVFHLPKEVNTRGLNIVEIFVMLIILGLVISSLFS